MGIEVKKGDDPFASISQLNQLIITLEQAELKLEEAFSRNSPEQVKIMKDFILKLQKSISEAIR